MLGSTQPRVHPGLCIAQPRRERDSRSFLSLRALWTRVQRWLPTVDSRARGRPAVLGADNILPLAARQRRRLAAPVMPAAVGGRDVPARVLDQYLKVAGPIVITGLRGKHTEHNGMIGIAKRPVFVQGEWLARVKLEGERGSRGVRFKNLRRTAEPVHRDA